MEGNAGVACLYFDIASQEEQSPAVVLGSVLKQVVRGLDEVPEKVIKAFRDRGKVIGGGEVSARRNCGVLAGYLIRRMCIYMHWRPRRVPPKTSGETSRFTQPNSLEVPRCSDIPDRKATYSGGVENHLAGSAVARSITPAKDDIITFLREKLTEDTIPDATDKSLEEEIIQNIPATVSEM